MKPEFFCLDCSQPLDGEKKYFILSSGFGCVTDTSIPCVMSQRGGTLDLSALLLGSWPVLRYPSECVGVSQLV